MIKLIETKMVAGREFKLMTHTYNPCCWDANYPMVTRYIITRNEWCIGVRNEGTKSYISKIWNNLENLES